MGYRRRIHFTEKQEAEIWHRWQLGEPMSSIGGLFDRNSSSIYPLLARTGGIRPPERRRSRLAISRMTLNYFSPAERFEKCVAAIG